ncbi:MAG: hypothetical protein AAF235_01520 [Planctomycetota bacterium]
MQNVEFKAELRDENLARAIAGAIGVKPVISLRMRDTYFRVVTGRLKRREAASIDPSGTPEAEPVEVIRYERDDRPQPKLSFFTIFTEAEASERFGDTALPTWLIVEKTRDVMMFEQARVHFDTVDRLGKFIEFEVLVTPRHNVSRGHELIDMLRQKFAPAIGEPIAASYADLLARDTENSPAGPAGPPGPDASSAGGRT